jgi:type II secretory pathway predicted ATPase ExeA
MSGSFRTYFGLQKEPFRPDPSLSEILETEEILGVRERLSYAMELGAVALVTGEVGSGKSTAVRHFVSRLHPSEHRLLSVTAASGSILEIYRLILAELGIETATPSRATLLRTLRHEITYLSSEKKMRVVLLIDEASLLRLEVFAELHTISQFHQDSRPWLPIVLTGQSHLVDKLMYPGSRPLASRVVARSHLEGVDLKGMGAYIKHHLKLAGARADLFEDGAVLAIHQGSGGLFRKANHLARGGLIAAARNGSATVSAEHIRLAATEVL